VRLAKPCLDLGLYCSDILASRAFYEGTLGLPYEELLKIGGGQHQHRVGLLGAVLKLNATRTRLDPAGSCLRGFVIAGPEATVPVRHHDPDGIPVDVVPSGHDGIETVGVRWATSDPDRLGLLLSDGLGATAVAQDVWRVGTTLLLLEHDPAAAHGPQKAAGFRYLTVQVFDVVAEHARLLDLGWSEGMAPVLLGAVAAISFVRDPDGVWLEISQRASLTGDLPADMA
jgi:catechol 2,3-dioxygenase-like lactoylglutathione lyase family enzyme